ncbi:hypothetical protein [Bulleidia sp. zg-1006]|uniref:hypothetical protein n=1 Tax=Bulleidia sp. zg-1006 TaxID=2806552 RepID=UPI00193A5D69|nr:hypothetical protein [Bulleidia sp. zg-1006]QRG87034.1 hypothetical protein JOS54_01630 [Bulleidia sp. zg-1006]
MFKKIITITTTFAFLCVCIVSNFRTYAIENQKNLPLETYSYVDNKGHTHQYFDIYGNPVTIERAKTLLNSKMNFQEEIPSIKRVPVYPFTNTVLVTSHYQGSGSRVKVTPDVRGPATLTYGRVVTTSSGYSVNFGAEINLKIFKAVALKFGVSYTRSSTSAESFGAHFGIPSGKIGAVYFTPFLYVGNCKYIDSHGRGTATRVYFPKKLGSFTDGLYEVILR